MKLKVKILFSFLLFTCVLFYGCQYGKSNNSSKYNVMKGTIKFNHDAESTRYYANPWETEWEYKCKYNSTLTLVFQGGTLDILVEDIGNGEYRIIAKERIIK